jgi:ATP adenylyltransferase/5',5'''-P-1,P-4-tetraphosphate phosphorylase II
VTSNVLKKLHQDIKKLSGMTLARQILAKAEIALAQKSALLLFLSHSIETTVDHGIKFLFHRFDPSLLSSIRNPPQKYPKDPLLPPFDADLHVCDLRSGASHHVIVNKFMHMRGHIVLSSTSPSLQQGERLNASDFSAFSQVLETFGTGIAYYNSNAEAGCTQLHKHIQFVPLTQKPLFDAMAGNAQLPFAYAAASLPDHSPGTIRSAYVRLLDSFTFNYAAYNFIVGDRKAVLVPRSAARHPTGIVVNAIGMCGHLSLWDWSDPEIRVRPLSIIADLSVRVS